ncbi:hypothetical protein [Actinomadura litoris]|uniref:hypothetical protein n=1 Tax=Actinomadura litoris TaxID=2678616 RepID=UPI001FA782E4|nr:hypothetical protein [Actinomadura litoris]
MICQYCRDRKHTQCRGGTHCDCQHRPGTALPPWEQPSDDIDGPLLTTSASGTVKAMNIRLVGDEEDR